ncbi:MAG: PorV/PorQ family protein [Elusimicrobia bacterium]|nr:PorV/PorQ family protein [Elusimicrobiota bacterium]
MRRLAILILMASPALARAEGNPGVTAAQILQISPSPRAVGMGSAFTGVASDLSALYYNPAGLSTLDHHEVGFTYMKGAQDQSVEYHSVASPLPLSGIIGNGYATLGAGLLYAQNGKIEVNRDYGSDPNRSACNSDQNHPDYSFCDTRTLRAGDDLTGTLSYSERLAETSFEPKKGPPVNLQHSLGLAAKFVRSTLAQEYSASAFAGDAGYLVRSPELGFGAGLAVQNFGSKMTFISEGDPLPLTFRSGFSYLLPLDMLESPPNQSILFALDGDYLYYEEQWHANFGIEYSALRMCALRLGYQLHRDLAGLTFGFGLMWRDIGFDYAWQMTDALGDIHQFGVSWRFGKVSALTRRSPHRPFIERMPEHEDIEELEKKTPEVIEPTPRRPRKTPADKGRLAPGWIY